MPQRKKDMRVAGRIKEKAGDFAEFAEEKIDAAKLKTEKYMEENPWKSVAIASGIGAVIGAIVALGVNALIERKQPTARERIRSRIRDWL